MRWIFGRGKPSLNPMLIFGHSIPIVNRRTTLIEWFLFQVTFNQVVLLGPCLTWTIVVLVISIQRVLKPIFCDSFFLCLPQFPNKFHSPIR